MEIRLDAQQVLTTIFLPTKTALRKLRKIRKTFGRKVSQGKNLIIYVASSIPLNCQCLAAYSLPVARLFQKNNILVETV